MRYTILVLFTCIFIIACNNSSSDSKKNDSLIAKVEIPINKNFRLFIEKFSMLQLPLALNPFAVHNMESLPILYGNDTAFINTEYKDPTLDKVYAYGILPDTTNSFKIIWLKPGEIHVFMLTTFSKQGQKVSEDYLGIGRCGSDCCYTCTETIQFDNEMNIYSADTIKSCKCEADCPDLKTMRKYVLFKTAKIAIDGRFKFSEEKEKNQ